MFVKFQYFCIVYFLLVRFLNGAMMDLYKNSRLGNRIVQTRYGWLQWLVLPLEGYKFLKPIETFLGVPYATPPTKMNSSCMPSKENDADAGRGNPRTLLKIS